MPELVVSIMIDIKKRIDTTRICNLIATRKTEINTLAYYGYLNIWPRKED